MPPAVASRPRAPTGVVVIGAGMAGLTAARRLAAGGVEVVVVDKGRGVGGRLATRRMGGARLDHGAQFFTARGDDFSRQLRMWLDGGVAREWCRGFRRPPDGHPRYVGSTGMTTLAKDLASGLDVRLDVRVSALSQVEEGWQLAIEGTAGVLTARSVLATAPVPQTLALLDAGAADVGAGTRSALEAVRYDPTMAALVLPASASAVPAPGGVQLDGGLISWVGDNAAKGISAVPAVTLHASGPASAARWDDAPEAVLAELLAAGAGWLGPGGAGAEAQLVRWRYAQPTVSYPDHYAVAVDGERPLLCAGDAFGEARVEGAFNSGWAAAGALLERLCP